VTEGPRNNLTERRAGQVKRETRYDYAAAVGVRYQRSSREQKGWILDEFCAATGYNRKYAIKLLCGPLPRMALPVGHGRPPLYGQAEAAVLRTCWEIADHVCSKRLAPFLPELLDRLRACSELSELSPALVDRAANMSAATIDRLLAPYRALSGGRGRSMTRPGSLLRNQVPIKTFADWDSERPGFLEIDLVAHCGSTAAGQFLFTLTTVDVATGWTLCRGVSNKGEEAVFNELTEIRRRLPFPLLGLDSDNGGEFINRTLVRYCEDQSITLTRARPYRKNDSCHVEQKNWSVVRRLVGYARFEQEALPVLNSLYTLAEEYVNFLQPVLKLVDKTRDGARVHRRYDMAQTPYRRLLSLGNLPAAAAHRLQQRYLAIHPLRLKTALEHAQTQLSAHGMRSHSAVMQRMALGQVSL
jgi:hypothetical protein